MLKEWNEDAMSGPEESPLFLFPFRSCLSKGHLSCSTLPLNFSSCSSIASIQALLALISVAFRCVALFIQRMIQLVPKQRLECVKTTADFLRILLAVDVTIESSTRTQPSPRRASSFHFHPPLRTHKNWKAKSRTADADAAILKRERKKSRNRARAIRE